MIQSQAEQLLSGPLARLAIIQTKAGGRRADVRTDLEKLFALQSRKTEQISKDTPQLVKVPQR